MITVRKSDERGSTKVDWLDSRHTFSFGDYSDPTFESFGALRVINEVWIAVRFNTRIPAVVVVSSVPVRSSV
jgi:redox-sensitive bicupin YhaK (pirin superfamily)